MRECKLYYCFSLQVCIHFGTYKYNRQNISSLYMFIITYPFFLVGGGELQRSFLSVAGRVLSFASSLQFLYCVGGVVFFFKGDLYPFCCVDERRESVGGNHFVFNAQEDSHHFFFRSFSFAMNESQRMIRMAQREMVLGNDEGFVWSNNSLFVY